MVLYVANEGCRHVFIQDHGAHKQTKVLKHFLIYNFFRKKYLRHLTTCDSVARNKIFTKIVLSILKMDANYGFHELFLNSNIIIILSYSLACLQN
jgi:hypothetical protein